MTIFAMIGRFFITFATNTGMQLTFEIFPTPLRSQGGAVASTFSLIFSFFSPYIVYSVSMMEIILYRTILQTCSSPVN